MKSLQFNFTLDEINLILESLGQMPFVKVHQLIASIQQQAERQLNEGSTSELEEKENGRSATEKNTPA